MDGALPMGTRDPGVPPGLRSDVEAWFVRRGVPQLVDDYTSERSMDARARPFVVVWLVGGSFLWWGTKPDAPIWVNVAGGLVVLVSMGVGVAGLRKLRGHVKWWEDRRLEVWDTFLLAPLIAVPSALIEGSWGLGVSNGLNALLGMAVIYLVIGFGLGEIAWWSAKRLSQELARITGLLARTLPILLILVLFLLFAAELWEAAHLLSVQELFAMVLLLGAIAALLVLTTFSSELRAFRGSTTEQLRSSVTGTPAAPLAAVVSTVSVPKLRLLQRLNLSVLVVLAQLIQSAFVAFTVALFLAAFGLIALPASLQELWIGESVTGLASFELLGESRILSRELLIASCLLGGVVGLYFTGLAVTDSAYRNAHFQRIVDEVRQLLSAHAFYVAATNGANL